MVCICVCAKVGAGEGASPVSTWGRGVSGGRNGHCRKTQGKSGLEQPCPLKSKEASVAGGGGGGRDAVRSEGEGEKDTWRHLFSPFCKTFQWLPVLGR